MTWKVRNLMGERAEGSKFTTVIVRIVTAGFRVSIHIHTIYDITRIIFTDFLRVIFSAGFLDCAVAKEPV